MIYLFNTIFFLGWLVDLVLLEGGIMPAKV
jgi:hypothetical protein